MWQQNPLHLGEHSEPIPDFLLLKPRDNFYADIAPTAADEYLEAIAATEAGVITVQAMPGVSIDLSGVLG